MQVVGKKRTKRPSSQPNKSPRGIIAYRKKKRTSNDLSSTPTTTDQGSVELPSDHDVDQTNDTFPALDEETNLHDDDASPYSSDEEDENKGKSGPPAKSVQQRMEELFTHFQAEEIGKQYRALSEIEKGCQHALRCKEKYENAPTTGEGSQLRQQIHDTSILFRYLTLSPACVELMKMWDHNHKHHNKKM